MNKYFTVAALIITHALVWLIHGWYDDSIALKIDQVKTLAAKSTADEIAKIKVENKTIMEKTIERTKTETVYRDCVADVDMMALTNKVLIGK
jgi:hypothetical protein